MALNTYRWDMADHIATYDDVDAHLKIAHEDNDPRPHGECDGCHRAIQGHV